MSQLTHRLGTVLLFLALLGVTAQARKEEPSSSWSIRRILLPGEKVPRELKRLKDGVLTRLSRKEFESLVRAAEAGRDAIESLPRLVEARYRAALIDGSALVGTAQWKVRHDGDGPGLLRLTGDGVGFNLAVKQPRFDNREAILTSLPEADGKNRFLGLVVDKPGEHAVTLEWSARAEPRPEGMFVDLRIPDCPAGMLELELPADPQLSLVDGSPISGPHPTEARDRRLWRIAIGRKSQMMLMLRRTTASLAGVLLAWHKMAQRLSPDGLETTSTFTVESLGKDVRELIFEFDPLLRPVDVRAPGIERWDTTDPPGRLTIRLSRPLQEGVVEIRCVGPLTDRFPMERPAERPLVVPWKSPAVRLIGAVQRGEILELLLHPEIRLLSWRPGDFRLTDSSVLTDLEQGISNRRLILQGGGLISDAIANSSRPDKTKRLVPERPGGMIQTGGVEFRAVQQSWWRFNGEGMELISQINYDLRQGQLFQMAVRLPLGWEVDTVETTPAELLRSWLVRAEPEGALLLVDLRRPLRVGMPDSTSGLLLRLRRAELPTWTDLPFPDVVPVGASYREGGLAIDYDEQAHRATLQSSLTPGEAGEDGPWGKLVPDHYYLFRGENPTGTVRLEPRPPAYRAGVVSDASLNGERTVLNTRLVVEGESGTASFVDVHLSGEDDLPWEWRSSRAGSPLLRLERLWSHDVAAALTPLGASPLAAVSLAAVRSPGSTWRIWLDRPLSVRQTVTLQATRTLHQQVGNRYDLPLLTVLGAARQEGEISLHLIDGELVSVDRVGLIESSSRDGSRSGDGWRSYKYTEGRPRLSVQTRPTGPGTRTTATIERARLTSVLTTSGELNHHLRFRLSLWPQRFLPVRLPEGAKLVAVALDGHWLESASAFDDPHQLLLPVPSSSDSLVCEIFYVTPQAPRAFWARLQAPFPELPVDPIGIDRRWLLPPGVLPMSDSDLILLPGARATEIGTRSAGARLLELLQVGPKIPLPDGTADADVASRQAILDACAGICGDYGGTSLPLAILVEELVNEWLGRMHPLIIDRQALRRAGLDAGSRLRIQPTIRDRDSPVPWDDEDLLLIPLPSATLLTTRDQFDASSTAMPEIVTAVQRAAERGQDASGQFVTALEWLGRASSQRLTRDLFHPGRDLNGWTAWEPIAGNTADSLIIVHREVVSVGGFLLAGLLLAGFSACRRCSPVAGLRFLLLGLAIAGLGLAWLPSALVLLAWWPLLAGLMVAIPWYLLWALRGSRSASIESGIAAALLLAPLVLLGDGAGPAAADDDAEEFLVFLVPQANDPTGAVLARPSLIEKLRAAATSRRPPTSGAILVAAAYDGKLIGDDRAEFSATFLAHSFSADPVSLELPLEDAQLVGDVLLDGVRVLPVALPAPRLGYAIRVSGVGSHKVELRFQLGLTKSNEDDGTRQVRFGAPPLIQSRVSFELPPGATYPRVVVKHGSQQVVTNNGVQKLEVELGAINSPLQLRWYQEPQPIRPPRLEFREAYLWDLRVDASLLTALVRYNVRGGAVTSLLLDVPFGLEVRSVQARRPSSVGEVKTPSEAIRLTEWSMRREGESRVVQLDFSFPISGVVEVTLELVPASPWSSSVLLPLPRPQGEAEPNTPSYLAYRHLGLEVTRTDWLGLTGIRPELFAPFWSGASRPSVNTLDYASSFRRDPRQSPELRLGLRPATPRLEADHSITLQVGSSRAELSARIDLVAPNKDLSLVEYEIDSPQPVTIANVTGPDVSRWSRTGTRLLVWLERTTGSTRLELSGWLPLVAAKAGKPPELARVELPCLRLVSSSRSQTRLVLRPLEGLTLASPEVRQLTAERPTALGETVYVTKQTSYGGIVIVQPGPAPTADVLLSVHREGQSLAFLASIDYRNQAEIRSLGVRLRGWEGDSWLESPPKTEARRREQHRRSGGPRERFWSLDLVPGITGSHRLTLRGKLPLADVGGPLDLPEILVSGARMSQTIQLDDELIVESSIGMRETEIEGKPSWRVAEDGWSLRIQPRPRTIASPESVLLTENRSAVLDGKHWRHETRFWVRHETPAELRVLMPTGLLSAHLTVDGLTAGLVEGSEAKIPLSGTAGIREVVLVYRFDPALESLERPLLTPPLVLGTRSGSLLWTVDVPAGWEIASSSGGTRLGAGPTRRAVIELHRAELAWTWSRELAASRRTSEIAAVRNRFARSLALARLALRSGADDQRPLGPNNVDLNRWLADLEAHVGEIDDASLVEPGPDVEEPPSGGTPYGWRLDRSESNLTVRLAPASREQARQAIGFSGQWLFVLLGIWTITTSSVLYAAARRLWPESLLLVALFGWYFVGPTLVVLSLLSLGVLGRFLLLAASLKATWRWLRTRQFSPGSTPPLSPR